MFFPPSLSTLSSLRGEVIVMDVYYLDSMYLIYVMHADILSSGFSI